MKNVPKWAVLAALLAVAYMIFKAWQSGDIRRDAWRASQAVSDRTGLPAAPRSWLPGGGIAPGDPQFGVTLPAPPPLPTQQPSPWQSYLDYWGVGGPVYSTQPVPSTPTFGVGVHY